MIICSCEDGSCCAEGSFGCMAEERLFSMRLCLAQVRLYLQWVFALMKVKERSKSGPFLYGGWESSLSDTLQADVEEPFLCNFAVLL